VCLTHRFINMQYIQGLVSPGSVQQIMTLNCVVSLTALRRTEVKTLLATIHVAIVGCHGNPVYRAVTWIPICVSVTWTPKFSSCGRFPWEAPTVATFTDRGVSRSQLGGFPTAVISISRPKPNSFLQVAPQLWLSGPRSKPTTCQKIW
jgi:hypothetical protein